MPFPITHCIFHCCSQENNHMEEGASDSLAPDIHSGRLNRLLSCESARCKNTGKILFYVACPTTAILGFVGLICFNVYLKNHDQTTFNNGWILWGACLGFFIISYGFAACGGLLKLDSNARPQ